MKQTYLRADFEHPILPEEHTSTPSRNRVDIQLWTLDRHASRDCLENVLERTTIATDVG